jgi:hypothetical protein
MFIATQQRHKWLHDIKQLSAREALFSATNVPVSQISKEMTASPTQELEERHSAIDCFRLHWGRKLRLILWYLSSTHRPPPQENTCSLPDFDLNLQNSRSDGMPISKDNHLFSRRNTSGHIKVVQSTAGGERLLAYPWLQ